MSQRSTRRALEADLTRVNAGYKLRDVYAAFAGFGEGQAVAVTDKDRFENSTRVISGTNHQLDSRKFMKLCKDCGLLSPQLTRTDVDLIFLKAVPKGARKMSQEQFQFGCQLIADKVRVPLDALVARLSSPSMRPATSGTRAQPNRFHDDRATYTVTLALSLTLTRMVITTVSLAPVAPTLALTLTLTLTLTKSIPWVGTVIMRPRLVRLRVRE
eukprot:TRINITY_DN9852_c0_g1_i11.p1 TRINITY_DN9852_c0_g1~~TRINITY_DN9852_c0_g1_i11.p1  ORF type:complete len:214 (+),score=33.71 TRINITY_DN9852_c0_g1_i11:215-856(+)